MSREKCDESVTREEKSREEKRIQEKNSSVSESVFHKETPVVPSHAQAANGNGAKPKATARKRAPADFTLTEERKRFGFSQGLVLYEVQHEFETFKDFEFKTAHTDWDATWRVWARRAGKDKHGGIQAPAVVRGGSGGRA